MFSCPCWEALDFGADVTSRDPFGWTALHIAASKGKTLDSPLPDFLFAQELLRVERPVIPAMVSP